MSGIVDLHLHTHYSDGLHPPAEVLRLAREAGVGVAAITDHDTLGGLPEAHEAARSLGIRLIPAAELSIEFEGEDIHLLAYFLDPQAPGLVALVEGLRQARQERLLRMLKRLRRLGLPLRRARVMERVGTGAPVGRPHVAAALAAEGWIETYDEAFRHYLGSNCPAYVPNRTPSPEEAIRIVLQAGAVPVLAHPTTYRLERLLDRFIAAGLLGLEVYHPCQDDAQTEYLRGLAAERGLLETGGSDYHGGGRGDAPPGSVDLGADLLARLEEGRARIPETLRRLNGFAG